MRYKIFLFIGFFYLWNAGVYATPVFTDKQNQNGFAQLKKLLKQERVSSETGPILFVSREFVGPLATLEAYRPYDELLAGENLASYIQSTYSVDSAQAEVVVQEALANATRHSLEPELILAVIAVESTFKPSAVSNRGAQGLMQIMPKYHQRHLTAVGATSQELLTDLQKNMDVGSRILVEYLKISKGDLSKALLRYNGSLNDPQARYAKKVMGVYRQMKSISQKSKIDS